MTKNNEVVPMSIEDTLRLALEVAYLAGFNASGEGYNGEYPFGDKNQNPEHDAVWCKDRDNVLEEALAKQEQPYADKSASVSNDRIKIDPVTGNVNIGTAKQSTECVEQEQRSDSEQLGEPVAWVNVTDEGKWYVQYTLPKELMPEGTKFYTTSQQRTWVELTESDRRLINFQWQDGNGTPTEIIDLVEAKLKEKNSA